MARRNQQHVQPAGTRVGILLLWLVASVLIPLLLFCIGTVWRVHEAQRQQQQTVLVDQAHSAAQRLDQAFDKVQAALDALAESVAAPQADNATLEWQLATLRQRLGGIPIALLDNPVQPGPAVSNAHTAEALPDRTVAVSVPAGLSRTLTATLRPNWLLQRTTDALGTPPGTVTTIRDRAGRVVATNATSKPNDAMVAERSIAPASGFSVESAMPRSAFASMISRDLTQIILIGLILLAGGLLAATALARRLVKALRTLERNDPAAITTGLREIDELAARLRIMSDQRTATEATLRASEARLRDLVGTLDLASIMTRELDGTIRFWSHGCARTYGWTAEEAVGRISHDLLQTRFPESQAAVEHALIAEDQWSGDLIHIRRDGRQIIVAAHKALQRDPEGNPYMVMESLIDVTALREAQDTLRLMNVDLEQRVQQEVAARQAAQARAAHADRIQALGQLAGGIAHDFNNVLQAVAGGAALIARRPDDATAVERLVQIIGDAAGRGASITRRMLVLARHGDLQAEPIDPATLLAGMHEVFIHTLGAQIVVLVAVPPGLPALLADKAQLETALVNLGTNARDAMPNGGVLRLDAALEDVRRPLAHVPELPPGRYIRLSVTDSGTGMTPEVQARAGEPFFTTKDVGKGTGLGLSMVKGFASQSAGAFAIDSEPQKGTIASLWLPAMRTPASADRRATPPTAARIIGCILLVDDDKLVRDTLSDQLVDLGHKVLTAACGTDALAILRARDAVDLMITDLSMPGMNGLTLIREARDLLPNLPAILLTGYAGDAAALETAGVKRGSYALVRKPASGVLLNARVMEMLDPV